jgi:predicted O-methyltransferase YrrM
VTATLSPEEILERLRRLAGLERPLWLTGGVAVDFLVGSWTRPHRDLDLLALSTDRALLEAEIRERGLRLVNDGSWTTRWSLDDRDVGEVEIVWVEPDGPNTGVLVIPENDPAGARPGRYRLAEGYLVPDNVRTLDGVRFRVCSAEGEWLHRLRGSEIVPGRRATPEIEHDIPLLAKLVPETRLRHLRDVRDRLISEGCVVAHADGRRRELFPVAIGAQEGRALAGWVRSERAARTLETGLGFAISTLFICDGLLSNGPDGLHVAADPYQTTAPPVHGTTYAGVGLQVLEEAGVRDLVEFYPEESQIVLHRLLADGRQFDLAFLDGSHRFERVFLDLIYSGRLLKEGGIVFVDDAQLATVRKAVEFCVTNLGWATEDADAEGRHHEWVVLRTGSRSVLRPYTEFVDF